MTYEVDTLLLKSKIVLKGYNTVTFSAKIGISRNTLSGILNGKKPTYTIMDTIINELNLENEEAANVFFKKKLTHYERNKN